MTEHLDVLIVGAGISGISAAWHLQDRCPSKSYAILERRDDLGGTWDLFRYPGIRSDSDMFTLGFRFKPRESAQSIDEGYSPAFEGAEDFQGTTVHPQHWPEDLDYAGKRVVVIGSGATAVTLIPAIADKAAHVTMLQRSPTYIVARPAKDAIANWLYAKL